MAYGIAPAANLKAPGDHLVAQGMHQGPMTWHVLLDALHTTGHDEQIVKLLTDPSSDGPAKILAEGGTFMWEQWDPGCATSPCTNPSQSSSESMSHGWGSWGLVDMLQTLLGVTVAARHRRREVDAHGAGYVLDVHVPDNVTATVALPSGGDYVGVGDGAPRQARPPTWCPQPGDPKVR